MINIDKFNEILQVYKENFNKSHWEDEKYKWIAVKNFQENWNIEADDFTDMLKKSLASTGNLLTSYNFFPKLMIEKFSEAYSTEVKEMFINLYDESKDIYERILAFKDRAEDIRKKYSSISEEEHKSHYQTENSITTYLWLRYPEKYYIYKYSEAKKMSEVLEADYKIKHGKYENNIRNFLKLYDEVTELLKKDKELEEILNSFQTENCYKDTEFRAVAIDFGYFIKNTYDKLDWSLKEYSPDITAEEWINLLKDSEVFNLNSLKIMKRMKDIGETATFKELSQNYGNSIDFYDSESLKLAERIAVNSKCNVYADNNGKKIFWPILYFRKNAEGKNSGNILWKLRDELSEALENIDLEDVDLYDIEKSERNEVPKIWKISEGYFVNDRESLEDFEKRKVVAVSNETRGKAISKLTQWDSFKDEIKIGDYFYLCYGNDIRLFGRITSEIKYSKEINRRKKTSEWYERSYELVKEAVLNKKYEGIHKWWAPTDNSTCIEVPKNEQKDFEENILKPYFNMTLDEINNESKSDINYWWLNADPRIWKFSDLKIGEEEVYNHYNENGNKRRIYNNFTKAKKNDIIIGYEASPIKKITAIADIISNENEQLRFKITEKLINKIDYYTLKSIPELDNMEVFKNPIGSLFKLTKEEYNVIMDLIREENPKTKKQLTEKYSKEDFLDEVFMTEEDYNRLSKLLKRKKNIILQGAPGVGKTFTAKRLAYSLMGEKDNSRVEFVQFHQNYTYEDFIMGYKPTEDGFELKNGIFFDFCLKAESDPENEYYFIIDEINRGNLSKIFGELLMLIENNYREEKATLAYNGCRFSVPKNLYIIGMMNTADRSLAMIDYALRRRFSFFEMLPGFESEGFKNYQKKLNNRNFDKLIDKIINLNSEISEDSSLGRGFCIGHSYFYHEEIVSDEFMKDIIDFDIIPILEEYWFDEEEKIIRWKNILSECMNDEQ